jgi:outer membrane protein OmpA-like peptidoglycan-associated protein
MQKYKLTKKGKIVIATFCTIIVLFISLGISLNYDKMPNSYDYSALTEETPQQAEQPEPLPAEVEKDEFPKDIKATVYFEANMNSIDKQYLEVLDMFYTTALKYKDIKIQVEGNCATLFPSNEKQKMINYNLSLQRAQAIADYLTEKGIPAERINVVGNGSDKPLKDNKSPDGRKLNRRVDIYFQK